MPTQFYSPQHDFLKEHIGGYYFVYEEENKPPIQYRTFPNNYCVISAMLGSDIHHTENCISAIPSGDMRIATDITYCCVHPIEIYCEMPVNEITVYFKPLGINRFVKDLQKLYVPDSEIFDDFKIAMKDIFQIPDRHQQIAELSSFIGKRIEADSVKIPEGITKEAFIESQVSTYINPWMLFFVQYNPTATLQKVKCSVLALNGDKDLQVDASQNLPAIKAALHKGGNNKVTTKSFPTLNHMFQESETGQPSEYAEIEQTIAPEVLETMLKWIQQL